MGTNVPVRELSTAFGCLESEIRNTCSRNHAAPLEVETWIGYEPPMPMQVRSVVDKISFAAELVAAQQEQYTPDCIVHGIYFGSGDPELGGQHWNFTRILGDDDDGVCTVKEIQEVTVYGGIKSFSMTRTGLACEFDTDTSRQTGTRNLEISYTVDDPTWSSMIEQSQYVFQGQPYFTLERMQKATARGGVMQAEED